MADLTVDRTARSDWQLRWSGPIERARAVLRADAGLCLAAGGVLAVMAPWAARVVDGEPVGIVRLVGVALALYSIDLWLMGRARPARLPALLLIVAGLNATWLLATAATIATGALSASGVLLAVLAALPVLGLAREQLVAARGVRERIERYPREAIASNGDVHVTSNKVATNKEEQQ